MDFILKSQEQVLEISNRKFSVIWDDQNSSQIAIGDMFAIGITGTYGAFCKNSYVLSMSSPQVCTWFRNNFKDKSKSETKTNTFPEDMG